MIIRLPWGFVPERAGTFWIVPEFETAHYPVFTLFRKGEIGAELFLYPK
jgi:hypothetical protein